MPDASTRWTKEVRTRLLSLRLSPTRESEIVEQLSFVRDWGGQFVVRAPELAVLP